MMSRNLFDQIGGFDETLETGEDTEICLRAQHNGATIRCDKQLHAVHMGYPNDLGHFFRRERWHGKGNFQTWKQITSSKIPALVLLHALSFFVALLLPLFTGDWRWLLVYPVVALALSFAGAFKWLGGLAPNFLACMFLSWMFYGWRFTRSASKPNNYILNNKLEIIDAILNGFCRAISTLTNKPTFPTISHPYY